MNDLYEALYSSKNLSPLSMGWNIFYYIMVVIVSGEFCRRVLKLNNLKSELLIIGSRVLVIIVLFFCLSLVMHRVNTYHSIKKCFNEHCFYFVEGVLKDVKKNIGKVSFYLNGEKYVFYTSYQFGLNVDEVFPSEEVYVKLGVERVSKSTRDFRLHLLELRKIKNN